MSKDGPKRKSKWEFPIGGIKKMSREEADADVKRFMNEMERRFPNVPDEEIERGAKKVHDFIQGRLSWAELFNFTPEMLFQIAEFGFAQFKSGRYEDAERIFKVLTVLDWNNAYYHSVMGSILQKQNRYGEAIAEYSQALDLDPDDIASHTNRGEIFFQHGLISEAKEDLKKAIELDSDGSDKFANRAKMLMHKLVAAKKSGGGGKSEGVDG